MRATFILAALMACSQEISRQRGSIAFSISHTPVEHNRLRLEPYASATVSVRGRTRGRGKFGVDRQPLAQSEPGGRNGSGCPMQILGQRPGVDRIRPPGLL